MVHFSINKKALKILKIDDKVANTLGIGERHRPTIILYFHNISSQIIT